MMAARKITRRSLAFTALLMLGGCAQTIAEGRVRSALVDAGLSERNADCMAERMVDRLSIDQLRKLEQVKARPDEAGSISAAT